MARTHDDQLMTSLDAWEPDMDLGLVARAASFLDFAAKKKPGAPIPWSLVTKRVLGGARMPNPDSQIVIDMMRRASSIRGVLGRDFNRGLENISGLGVRATADADDFVQTQIKRKAKRARGAYDSLAADVAKVDRKAMKNKELKGWLDNLAPALASHNDRLSKLLLPPGEKDKVGEAKTNGAKK